MVALPQLSLRDAPEVSLYSATSETGAEALVPPPAPPGVAYSQGQSYLCWPHSLALGAGSSHCVPGPLTVFTPGAGK